METLQELKAVNKQERDVDRFRSAFRGYQFRFCPTHAAIQRRNI